MKSLNIITALKKDHSRATLLYPNGLEVKLSVTSLYEVDRLHILVQNNGYEEGETASILTDNLPVSVVADKIIELCLLKDEHFDVTRETVLKDIYSAELVPIV